MSLLRTIPLAIAAAVLIGAGPAAAATHRDPAFSFDVPEGWLIESATNKIVASKPLRSVKLRHGDKGLGMTMTVEANYWLGKEKSSVARWKKVALEVRKSLNLQDFHMGDLTVKGVPGFYQRSSWNSFTHNFSATLIKPDARFEVRGVCLAGDNDAALDRYVQAVLKSWQWTGR